MMAQFYKTLKKQQNYIILSLFSQQLLSNHYQYINIYNESKFHGNLIEKIQHTTIAAAKWNLQ